MDQFKLRLPKWSSCEVFGNMITQKQATEIIVKTDISIPDFKYASNEHIFCKELNKLFGISDNPSYNDVKDDKKRFELINEYYDRLQSFREKYGILDIEYIDNARITSSYVGGPHGWCNWDGNICQLNKNIGKWPSVEEVYKEWSLIAKTFPFLNLCCTLYTGEYCEDNIEPVVRYRVKDGFVSFIDVKEEVEFSNPSDIKETKDFPIFNPLRTEIGISIEDLRNKLIEVYGHIPN